MSERVIINRERSAGTKIEWHRIGNPKGDRLPGMPKGTTTYGSNQTYCTVMLSRTDQYGWHISIAHPFRHPTWNEIASARYALTPNDVVMVMVLPPEEEYVNVHEHCFHLHECRCPR